MNKIGITLGDPTGIGPEIVKNTIQNYQGKNKLILYGNLPKNFTISNLQKIIRVEDTKNFTDKLFWIETAPTDLFLSGNPSENSGISAYNAIKYAGYDAVKQKISAIATAPISKHFIQIRHPEFIGHTEFFANLADCNNFIMSFFSPKLNVAILTTHLALKDVSTSLSAGKITKQIKLIHSSLIKYFGIDNPKIALLGLNPHSGEQGKFGNEELSIFHPIIKKLNETGLRLDGPFPADTFFSGNYHKYDMIISAYHDQALIPFKMLSFDTGVNVTLGLPFVRTSVDHGTAFDIAGKNRANPQSMKNALLLAERMIG